MKIQKYVEKSLLFAIGTSYDAIWRNLNTQLKKEECNFLQAMILISLFFEESETVTPSRLADTFYTSRGNLSHCVTYLEKRGWVKRQLDEKDARSYQVILKPEGRKVATRLIKVIDRIEDFFEDSFGKQPLSSTITSLAKIGELARHKP